jgi:hypothetical protein
MEHAERFNQAAVEEGPLRCAWLIEVLLNVSTKDLACEGGRIRAGTLTSRTSLGDDGSRRAAQSVKTVSLRN